MRCYNYFMENWETIIDFTEIKEGGVDIEEVLAALEKYKWTTLYYF